MKRTLFKAVAAAVFMSGIGGPLLAKALLNEQKWFRVDDTGHTNPLDAAPCIQVTDDECAQLFERENASSPWTPVLLDGNPVYAYGIPTN